MGAFKLRLRLLAFLFLPPLALLLYALLQDGRVNWALSDEQVMRDWIVAAQADTSHLPPVHKRLTGGYVEADAITRHMQKQIAVIEQDHGWLKLRGLIAHLAELCALGAMAVGVALLAKLKYDSVRSMLSQTYMLDHLSSAWHRVTQLMMTSVGLLVAGVGLCLFYEAVWAYSNWDRGGLIPLLFSLPLWGVLLGGVAMLRSLRAELVPWGEPRLGLLGREMDRATAPGLWQWIDETARKAGTPAPDHIVVGVDRSWFVTSAQVFLQSRETPLQGRTLYVPLPYACAMSQEEATAVVGHELGHFASGDTEKGSRLSALYHTVRERIWTIVEPEDGEGVGLLGKPGIWVSLYFLERFDRAYHHWSRRQELAADQVGAKAAGERTFAIALLRVCALSELIDRLLATPQTRNLVQTLLDHLRQHPLSLDARIAEHAVEHPFDTHPPTLLRVQNLKLLLDEEMAREAARPVSELDTQWFNRLLAPQASAA